MNRILVATFSVSISLAGCERKAANDTGQNPGETTSIQREVVTPSGDWVAFIDYTYGHDGVLRHFSYEFRTFSGYDENTESLGSTRCVRAYDVSETGEMILRSEELTDLTTGEPVERKFYEPAINHWMTLGEAEKGVNEG